MGLVEAFAREDIGLIPGLDVIPAPHRAAVAVFLLIVLLVRPRGLLGKEA